MRIAVAGSVGNDHLMTFSGKFTDSLVAESLSKISLSFLVDDLDIWNGGFRA
jgi:adenosine kinase